MTRLLAEKGLYRLLFFGLEEPQRCITVMSSAIADKQRERLKEWADASQVFVSTAQPSTSKSLLKQELEKIKPKILMKLEEG